VLIKPILFKILGPLKNKKILEIGCGNGYWLRAFAKKGAKCIGIDASFNQIKLAKELSQGQGISFFQENGPHISRVRPNSIDTVLIIKVLLEIKSKFVIKKIIKQANLVLKKGGQLIISDLHPCAPLAIPTVTPPKGFRYHNSGTVLKAISTTIDKKKVYFKDVHWTLQDITQLIDTDKFTINQILEPEATAKIIRKYPSLVSRKFCPMDIIFDCRKK